MPPANTRDGASASQRLTRKKTANSGPAGPQNDEPASSKAEQHQKTFIINLSDDSSDDDDSDTSSQATTEVPRGVRFQLGGNDSQDDTGEAAFRAQPAGDMNGELDLVGDKQPQEHNAGQPAIAPVGTRQNEIPDSERSDDEVPAGTQTTNAHTNAHTASNIDVEADVNPANTGPAPHDKAKNSARKGPRMVASAGKTKKRKASDQEASTAARTGGREGASAPKNPKKRKSSDGVSLENHGCAHDNQAEREELPGNQMYEVHSAFRHCPPLADPLPQGADARETATSGNLQGEAAISSPLRASRECGMSGVDETSMARDNVAEGRFPIGTDERSDATQEVHTPAPTDAECTRSSQFLLCGAELLFIFPGQGCVEIEIDGCWWMQFVDEPLSSPINRGPSTIRVSSFERLAGPADRGDIWLCKGLQGVTPRATNESFL
ncbi:hypothetical protein BBO_09389 [Beauveria brongniartii RCEF 3172]|uniref:Uncharacterized protein n=1 Tax=Beauveria brongniartii RCEF 3172 TaxID=1081107 RepID=A0A166VRC0_9HYPO|nr:hypothetical protein BBO_09389 [Beauveria brongniartii RCEF 3172]